MMLFALGHWIAVLLTLSLWVGTAFGDVYLHNMRGSNNRLDEANRDRNNGNRMFDSQNNNRGGYNVGSLFYYSGEEVSFEWTEQHGCGNEWNDCELIIQYMCSRFLRDGVTTRTIPDQPANCQNFDCNNDVRYGMHETYDYYINCKYRKRNRGLFTADRQLNGQTAKYTRQNNNGQRRGYECPEERDYYPYWHPTPWVDIAVMTNKLENCAWYKAESENVKGRHFCSIPQSWYFHMVGRGGNGRNGFIPNTRATCEALNQEDTAMTKFLEEEQEESAKALELQVQTEYDTCLELYEECAASQERTDCLETLKKKGMNHADLSNAVPGCGNFANPAGPGIPHPYANCLTCLPGGPSSNCADISTAIIKADFTNASNRINGGCPPDYRVDQTPSKDGNIYCLLEKCRKEWHEPDDLDLIGKVRATAGADVNALTDDVDSTEYHSSESESPYLSVDLSSDVSAGNLYGSWNIKLKNCNLCTEQKYKDIIGAKVYITENPSRGTPSDLYLCGEIKEKEWVVNRSATEADLECIGAECIQPLVEKSVDLNSTHSVVCDGEKFHGKHVYIAFPGPGTVSLRGLEIRALEVGKANPNMDDDRTKYLQNNGSLFTYTQLADDGGFSCKERETTAIECRNDLPRAVWDLSPPHRDTVGYELGPPECVEADWSRHNHLGNVLGGFPTGFNFTFPDETRQKCAMRLRYNITTGDYNGLDPMDSGEVNSTLNRRSGGQPAKIDIGWTHSLESTNPTDEPWLNSRGYRFKQNPTVQVFDTRRRVTYCDAAGTHPLPQMNLNHAQILEGGNAPNPNFKPTLDNNVWKCASTGRQGGGSNPFCDESGLVLYDPSKCMDLNGTSVENAKVKFCPYDAPYHAERAESINDNTFVGESNKFCTPCAPTGPGPHPFHKGEHKTSLAKTDMTFNFAESMVWKRETTTSVWDSCPRKTFVLGSPTFAPDGVFDTGGGGYAVNMADKEDTDFELRLAINTAQFGRTFQDRSHRWGGKQRDEDLQEECDVIKEVTVRGKRGNIVQVFPGVEYDFTPNRLNVKEGECVHFHWSGSNTNPRNNAGQGLQGTDRSNIALLETFRGEGARGVQNYGGKGRNGRTWTTKNHEPGYEFFGSSTRSSTMADMSCPGPANLARTYPNDFDADNKFVHPTEFTKCAKCDSSMMGVTVETSKVETAVLADFRFLKLAENGGSQSMSANYVQKEVHVKASAGEACPADFESDSTRPERCYKSCEKMEEEFSPTSRPNTRFLVQDSESYYHCVHVDCNPASGYTSRPGFGRLKDVSPRVISANIGSPDALKFGQWGNSHPEHFDNLTGAGGDRFMGMSYQQLVNLALLRPCQLGGEMSELDDAGTDFHMRPVKITRPGTYNYMCTRNNNFSNRSQKGKISVSEVASKTKNIGSQGGMIAMRVDGSFRGATTRENSDTFVDIPPASFDASAKVSVSVMDNKGGNMGMGSTGDDKILLIRDLPNTAANLMDVSLVTQAGRRREGHAPALTARVTLSAATGTAKFYIWGFPESHVLNKENGKEYFDKPEPIVTSLEFISGGVVLYSAERGPCGHFCNETCSQVQPNCNTAVDCSECVRTEQGVIEGEIDLSRGQFRAFETNQVTIKLVYISPANGGHTHVLGGAVRAVPGTGSEIDIKLDVSCAFSDEVSIMRMDLTATGEACLNKPDLGGCDDRWQEIDPDSVTLKDCAAYFQVGGSTGTEPSGAYQAKKRDDLPIIVGVTVACVVLLLASILSAVYFRNLAIRDPKRWESIKTWPARKFNYARRSCSSSL
jgi:hypothetical protein